MSHHRGGTLGIRLLRWSDYCAFYNHFLGAGHVGQDTYWPAWTWMEDYYAEYTDDGFTMLQIGDLRRELDQLAQFGRHACIESYGTQSDRHSPAWPIEMLDWPLLYGYALPHEQNPYDEPRCFVTLSQDPKFLMLRMDPATKAPLASEPALQRELFLRARQCLQDFDRVLQVHCRIDKAFRLPGPDIEDWHTERTWTWDEHTDEERRRRRTGTLGVTQPTVLVGGDTADGVERIDYQEIHNTVGVTTDAKGRKVAPYEPDEGFQSAFMAARMRRRAQAAR